MADKRLRELIEEALAAPVEVDPSALDRQRYPDEAKARAAYEATERNKEVARLRSNAAAEAFAARKAADPETRPAVRTFAGAEVHFGHVKEIEGGVEVWLGDNTTRPPDYRIFNPPTLARDPQGDIEVRGQMYREDPLTTLAEVIASHKAEKKVRR